MNTYTEKEASFKWCPFARVHNGMRETPAKNRNDNGNPYVGSYCLGTRCMAWVKTDNKTFPSAPGEPERPSEPAGYCGLARGPQ